VFDEAHHLAAYPSGNKVRKTENFKLAEALKNHTRDMLLLSATPHQGDHFRFWMLIQLLNPILVKSTDDMIENRHRLNAVVFRRTKADACKPDGSALFTRRVVHTESFTMSEAENVFYGELREYLEDGFELAKQNGGKGRSLGFVMAIFQKIAASSFTAVRRTLRRRLLMLTLHEAVVKDENLDIDGRESLLDSTRALIHEEFGLPNDPVGEGEADRVLADLKVRLLKKLREEDLVMASSSYSGETAAMAGEELAATAINVTLPKERSRIKSLLEKFPSSRETKVEKLLAGLGALWTQNPNEKIVIFATYLGTVDLISREIEAAYPGQGVVVLKGGDHGSKLTAERRFKSRSGPKVLVCTAAGREGINLQFARIMFNFDLPWNPMDIEQRIGRIHRYGQHYTAQIYNLVLSDTIEGSIFLLLNDKLFEIARAVGKVDDEGNVAEDLRSQILGQLSERIKYDKLYQDALSDPELKRTKLELEESVRNANEARKVVFELFQDLDKFSLDDYKPFADVSDGMDRLARFLDNALDQRAFRVTHVDSKTYEIRDLAEQKSIRFTTDRDLAKDKDDIELLGLDHPLIQEALVRWRSLPSQHIGISVEKDGTDQGVLSWWFIETHGKSGEKRSFVRAIAVDLNGKRIPSLERKGDIVYTQRPVEPDLDFEARMKLLSETIEPMLQRELQHRELIPPGGGFTAKLIGWIELV
jgi:superfamily II DNA/RNA helicase